MSGGFGSSLVVSFLTIAVARVEPPPIQRPRRATSRPEAPVQEGPSAPMPEPAPPPGPAPTPATISEDDRAAESEEFTALLEPLPPPPEPEAKRRDPPPPPVARLDTDAIRRHGITIAPGVGVSLCGHDWCDAYRVGFGAQLEVGVRLGRFMPHVSVDGGSGSEDTSALEELVRAPSGTISGAHASFFGVGAGMTLFFKKSGRFDPYLTARFGYTRTRSRFRDFLRNEYTETVSRGSLRLGGGLDMFVAEYLSLGPRFDVTIGIAGRVCVEQKAAAGNPANFDSPSVAECYPTRNIEETARIYAQDLPVPVFVGLQLRVIIPWSGPRPSARGLRPS